MKDWKKILPPIDAFVVGLIPDVLAVAGAVCMIYGAAMIYPPAGWIMCGVLCIIAAIIVSKGIDKGGDGG